MKQTEPFHLGPDWRKTILDKVSNVLNNVDRARSIEICVSASVEEVPTIRYSIEEILIPVKEE